MSTTKHTAGPWRIGSTQGGYLYVEADQGKNWNNPTICHLYQDVTPDDSVTMGDWLQSFENSTANAHLIAAAPDLLAALEAVVEDFGSHNLSVRTIKTVIAAIDKAKGITE